jgi:hypothetical protein
VLQERRYEVVFRKVAYELSFYGRWLRNGEQLDALIN